MKALRVVAALSLVSVTFLGMISTRVQGQQRGGLKQFMRQKLDHSQKLLEGLTLENYTMVVENARALRKLSEDARWQVSPNINYLRLSSEFQDLADEMAKKAEQKNLDGATLAYVRLTLNCVKCHQLTRDLRITSLDSRSSGSAFNPRAATAPCLTSCFRSNRPASNSFEHPGPARGSRVRDDQFGQSRISL